ncbi:MAG: autotransporter outer membrane beta-barrel domain-containing protein [Pseudomonadota bacterium]
MNKKLLLSTILSSALLASTTAKAVDIPVKYDGNNVFDVGGTKFNGILALGQYYTSTVAPAGNDLDLSNVDNTVILQDIRVGTIPTDDLAAAISAGSGGAVSAAEVLPVIQRVIASTQSINGRTITLNGVEVSELWDLNSLFSNDLPELQELENAFRGIDLGDIFDGDELDNVSPEQFAQAQQLKADIAVIRPLLSASTLTETQAAQLETAKASALANPLYDEVRKSPEAQDELKDQINTILSARAAVNNEELRVNGSQALLERLKSNIALFVNPNPSSGANVAPIQKPDTAVTESLLNSSLVTRNLIDSRINGFTAVSAGDMMETYGVWVKGSYTRATQKSHGGSDGFTAEQKGATIGIDTGDETLVGIAYSFFKDDIKNKATKSNKEDITSHTISAYGKFDATNEVYVSGQAQFGIANIKKKRASGTIANDIASAKTKSTTIAAKAEIGYDYSMNNIHIIPSAGIAYTDVTVKGYKESGSSLNREVGKRTSNRTSGIAGLMVKYLADVSTMKLIPEAHANIDYAFNTKNSNTSVTILDGIAPIATPSQKLTKAYYNVGTSVKAIQSDMFEFTAGYDFGFAKKFQSHTGTLKVRVNL